MAAIKDLFAGEVVGRSYGARMTTDLVVRVFEQAVSVRRPAPSLVHHSDRRSQYCGHEYQALLRGHGMSVSMSHHGNCYDNAPGESFRGTLKTELVHHRRYHTRAEAVLEISGTYSRKRFFVKETGGAHPQVVSAARNVVVGRGGGLLAGHDLELGCGRERLAGDLVADADVDLVLTGGEVRGRQQPRQRQSLAGVG
ncbi:MAG: hypothetical protein QOJ76_886 [Acidobacteriota bacterium]|nr:hypothetical protein [Acidobacteriota bacterium]